MGYYTAYTLQSEPDSPMIEDYIRRKQLENQNFAYGVQPDGGMNDCVKWYDHETDIKELSKQFPEVVFTLSGEGEESTDIWKKYFQNGKMQVASAKIKFDAFDPKKLI